MTIVFASIVMFLLFIESNRFKTRLTPFYLMASIYLIGIAVSNTIGKSVGYYPVYGKTMMAILIFLMIPFFVGGFFFHRRIKSANKYDDSFTIYMHHEHLISILCFITLIVYLISMFRAISIYGISEIKGKNYGIPGHLSLICMAIMPLISFFFIKTKKIRYLAYIALYFMISAIYGGKYYIFIVVVEMIILILSKHHVTTKMMIFAAIGAVLLAISGFIIVYDVLPLAESGALTFSTFKAACLPAIKHLLYYFEAPFICSNSYFFSNHASSSSNYIDGLRVLFSPIVTIFEAITGHRNFPDIIMSYWAPISSNGYRTTSNVGGLFSESVYRTGFVTSLLYVILISFITYYFYNRTLNSKTYNLTTSFLLTIYILSFFSNYYSLLSIFEVFIYSLLFDTLLLKMPNYRFLV